SESPTSVGRSRGLRLVDVGDIDFGGVYGGEMGKAKNGSVESSFERSSVTSVYSFQHLNRR
ncbi:MAG: hypothetical protein K2H04_00740, partial [Bacteroidaceae bacterium]|nr:hypothetical protein [Bacteroidaceae bacterium]MDE5998596.1 hypothetical protein [Bacteroidaceae bacterium]